ncbi:MAG: mechanosensitive ion channel [Sedimentisphaerales bacterium]|nr:mechanosensitive ion channel [Sedimentisphaerales bacterium]
MFILQKKGFWIYQTNTKFLKHMLLILLLGVLSTTIYAQQAQNSDVNSTSPKDANAAQKSVLITSEIEVTKSASTTLEQIQSYKKTAAELPDLNAELKAKIDDIYNQALNNLNQTDTLTKAKQNYIDRRNNAAADLEKFKNQLAQLPTFAEPDISPDITLADAEKKLADITLTLEQSRKDATTLENEQKNRIERRTKIPEESTSAKQKIEEIQAALAATPAENQSPELTKANKILAEVQRRTLEATIDTNTEELLSYDARRDVLATKRDIAARQLAYNEKLRDFWQQKVNTLRQNQALATKAEALRAKEETKYSNKLIQEIAEYNVTLANLQATLAKKVGDTTQYSDSIQTQYNDIDKDYKEVQREISTTGNKISDVMGIRLLAKSNELPDIQQNRRQIKSRLKEISNIQLDLMKYEKDRTGLSDIDQYVSNLEIDPPVSESEDKAIRNEAVTYLQNRRNMLDAITDYLSQYTTILATLDARENSFVNIVNEYQNFINKNILWVKSNTKPGIKDLRAIISSIQWLIHPQNWKQVIKVIWNNARQVPFAYIAIILTFVLAHILHKKIHVSIVDLSIKVLDINTDSFIHTFKVFILTILLAINWPILILFIQWRLSLDTSGSEFILALSGGLKELAIGIFLFEILCHMAMPSGLMQNHFRVRSESLDFVRKHMHWFFIVIIPLTFIFRILQIEQQNNDLFNNILGLIIFIVILVIVAIFLLKLLRPTSPLVDSYLKRNRDGWIDRLRYIWYPLCLILPLTFSVLALMGYFYAAWHLYEKLMYTIGLVFFVFIFKAMLTRWLIVIRKKLSLIERQKRDEAAALKEAAEAKEPSSTENPNVSQPVQNKPEKTIFEISQQTNRLINAAVFILTLIGLWYVWQDVIPALSKLGEFELWNTTTAKGDPLPITIGSLLKAIIITIMTVVVARNVPGLLEIVVLRKIPIDAGGRFAITTVSRYIIVIVGLVMAFTEIGIGWSKVQWLVAAMTVGLGFGLQEIFANFISGLIILFEQPVRVDDVVTVGDITGTVSMIKIRATTIRKWDQTELIVPNKEFITGRLTNWTLTDKILRRDFVVGIAYGSDIKKAEKLLYEVAAANPYVLENPKPVVIFKEFGSSSLNFELRIFITGMDHYLTIWHDINCAIDDAFRKAKIEIAFPQQDIHIRSVHTNIPLDIEKNL